MALHDIITIAGASDLPLNSRKQAICPSAKIT